MNDWMEVRETTQKLAKDILQTRTNYLSWVHPLSRKTTKQAATEKHAARHQDADTRAILAEHLLLDLISHLLVGHFENIAWLGHWRVDRQEFMNRLVNASALLEWDGASMARKLCKLAIVQEIVLLQRWRDGNMRTATKLGLLNMLR